MARHCVQSKCFDPILQLLKVLFLFPFCTIITCAHGKKILKSSHTCTATHGESESKGESVSRTCKFLSVCEAAAAVGVMQPAINISEDLHAKEQNVHVSLYCIKTTVCDSSCAPPPPPRLEMTGFREVQVQRQIENYAHTFNFTPQQNKLKVVSLKHSLSVVSRVLEACALPFLSCLTY